MATEAQVHPKSSTQPLARRQPQLDRLHRADTALQALLNTPNWERTREVLDRDAAALLTDEAIGLLEKFIRDVSGSDVPEAADIMAYLEIHRQLLLQARVDGIGPAWEAFMRAEPEPKRGGDMAPPEVAEAVQALLGTSTWDETYAVLLRDQQWLLDPNAERLLEVLIQTARRVESVDNQRYLALHLTLLRESRELGIPTAWERFTLERRKLERAANATAPDQRQIEAATEALKSLLATESWDDTHRQLIADAQMLLSPLCDQILSDLIAAAQADPDPRARRGVVYLELHRALLRRCRTEGLEAAWEVFLTDIAIAQREQERESVTPATPPDERVVTAVGQFLGLASWDEARSFLTTHQAELLSDAAISLVVAEADRLRQRGAGRDVYAARLLDLQATLLRRTREVGLDRAWREFEEQR